MKNLYLFRGVPGSGKTTAANALCEHVISADDYFTDKEGNYKFIKEEIADAHYECKVRAERLMVTGIDVAIANTFTREWEMGYYFSLAKDYDYRVFSFIVENRHGNESEHDIPDHMLDDMKQRFEVKL